MKEYKVRYMWNGKVYAEPWIGKDLFDATLNFVHELHKNTNSYDREKAGFKICNE